LRKCAKLRDEERTVQTKDSSTNESLSDRDDQAKRTDQVEPRFNLVGPSPEDNVVAIDPNRNPITRDRVFEGKVIVEAEQRKRE
jgi:hypothetical protein